MDRKLKIAVIFGGCSPEYPVSLESAHSVIVNLDREKYEPVLLGITRGGEWFRFLGGAEALEDDSWHRDRSLCIPAVISPDRDLHGLVEFRMNGVRTTRLDAAFPVLHGRNGEDGTVQGLCELAGIPVVGCGTLASALCMDKDRAHKLAALAGVRVPRSRLFPEDCAFEELRTAAETLGWPLFVKPVRAGSSFGVSRVEEPAQLAPAVEAAFRHDGEILLEEAIPGFEVGCAVLGNRELTVGAVDEVELSRGFFNYTEKYTLQTSAIHCPARIAPQKAAEIRETAKVLYRALGCRGFARVDLFLTPWGEIVFNEVNTIPGFTPHSRYPAMMRAAGIPFRELVSRLIQLGAEL